MRAPTVIIVGGGFAGVQAARAVVQGNTEAQVTLIDRNTYATMVPALPDVLSGRVSVDSLAQPLAEAAGPGVSIVAGTAERIDLDSRRITASSGTYDYDYLVLTHGSAPTTFGFEPDDGVLHSVHTLDAAVRFRKALESHLARSRKGRVVVVGGGYTGLEVAACVTEGADGAGLAPRITVVEAGERVLGFLPERQRRRVLDYLRRIGVEIRTGTTLDRYAGGTAILSDGTRLENTLVCWAAGMQAQPTPIAGEVDRTRDGRLNTTPALQLPSYPEVFVAGDAAALRKDQTVARRAVNFAYYSGRRAGKNVVASIRERRPRRFRPVDLGWIIPLGGESVGRLFGALPVSGKLGLRLHYTMSGFRHFAGADSGEFYRTALHLRRRPDPLTPAEPTPGDRDAGYEPKPRELSSVARWFRSLRAYSFTATLIPTLLAAAVSYGMAGPAGPAWWTLPLFALSAVLFHAGTNVLNDYYDFVHGVDPEDDPDPAHVIPRGIVSPTFMRRSGHVYFLLGIAVGLPIGLIRGVTFVLAGLAGALGAYAYTNARFSLKYRGLGDLLVFFLMGPALVAMGEWALVGRVSAASVLVSLPIAFLVASILHGNNFRNMESDARAGVTTLAGLLGIEASKTMFAALVLAPFIAVVGFAAAGNLGWLSLLALLTLPMAIALARRVARASDPARLVTLPMACARLHMLFGALYVAGILAAEVWPA